MSKSIEDLLINDRFRKFVLNPNQGDEGYWEAWSEENDDNKLIFEEAKSIIKNFYEPLSSEEFQTEAINFKRKINITPAEKKNIINLYETRRPARNLWFVRVAASLLIIFSFIFVFNWFYNQNHLVEEKGDNVLKIITKETTKGQKMTITFQDGTVVKLNAESSISYPEEFDKVNRNVVLNGEAYFDVAHYDNWPFIVKTKDVETKVLGTSFNISSYPESNFIDIALVEGKVEVISGKSETLILKPMEMAQVVNGDFNKIKVRSFDFKKITGWKDNLIVFEKASFQEVKNTLERWYNVKFICNSTPYFDGGYTGEFADLSLDAVLAGMSTEKFQYKIEGKNIIIN